MIINDMFIYGCYLFGGFCLAALFFTLFYQRKRYQFITTQELLRYNLHQVEQDTIEKNRHFNITQQKFEQLQQKYSVIQQHVASSESKLQQYAFWQTRYDDLYQEYQSLNAINSRLQAELRETATLLQTTLRNEEEKQQILKESEKRLSEQFEILANRIFEQSHVKVDEHNKKSLNSLLIPLKEQMEGFRKQVQDSFVHEEKERHTLTHEIQHLQKLNQQMAKEAVNLTNALKGNNKIQGNWGEMILSQILENIGLRKGIEFDVQVSLKNEANERQQPDVIVHLPQHRKVIIDAKMTLVAYEKYYNSDDLAQQNQALAAHITAIRTHVKLLSQKNYQQIQGINSLDYILMFIPIEGAFSLANEHAATLINEALQQNIIIVSPSTLIIALKTIHNLWRYEYQNQHTEAIAEQAAKLYDKLRLFTEDMLLLGDTLNKAQQTYKTSMNKLSDGRGNMIEQAEKFRQWGVEVKKINPTIKQD